MMPCRYHCEGDNSRWVGRSEDSRWNTTWHDPGHVQEGGTPPWGRQLQRRSSGGQCTPLTAVSASMLLGLCIQGVIQGSLMHMFSMFLEIVLHSACQCIKLPRQLLSILSVLGDLQVCEIHILAAMHRLCRLYLVQLVTCIGCAGPRQGRDPNKALQ